MLDLMGAGTSTRILWVSHEIPDRNMGGGSIRQYHLLRALANRAQVDLLLVGQLKDTELREELHNVTELDCPAYRSSWRRRVGNLRALLPGGPPSEVESDSAVVNLLRGHLRDVSDYRLVQIEHEGLARLLPQQRSAVWAITLHNLTSVWSGQRATLSKKRRVRWLHQTDVRHARRLEHWIVGNYDVTIAVSEEDCKALGGGAVVVPNGVDLNGFVISPLPSAPRVVFTGSFNWLPNIDGAQWLCREVLPRVRAEIPEATFILVGRDPHERVRGLGAIPGVELHFDVPTVAPFLQSARAALVPLRMGSGTRLKALEAMAAERPLAGTSIGLEGLGLRDGYSAAIADTSESLAAAIVRLCREDDYAAQLSRNARRLAESRFSWDGIAGSYVDTILSASSRQRQ